ncbi:hypothetical protein [Xylella fastidiosa]|uniref:hypothetical protein n=1 Tax=Xylella fastidiosa TaxID=2371 RepID=UPI001EEA50A0|nr:hypothetical protein [Xylella fastidiosa]
MGTAPVLPPWPACWPCCSGGGAACKFSEPPEAACPTLCVLCMLIPSQSRPDPTAFFLMELCRAYRRVCGVGKLRGCIGFSSP